jgi:hypothetical protein
MVIVLFNSKLKNYNEVTVKIWVDLLKVYDIEILSYVIKRLIYTKDDFISVGLIDEMIKTREKIGKTLIENEKKKEIDNG